MKPTILVADDEKNNLQVILNIIEEAEENFRVIIAPEGKTACEFAISEQPDVILMDWIMPVMSGIDAVRYIKSNEQTKDIPILMVTSLVDSERLEEALVAGCVDYIKKPVEKTELLARVRAAIQSHQYLKEVKTQKIKIESQNKKIADSINYARRIQASILDPVKIIKESFPDSFVLYRIKDVLSGDFHWYFKKDNEIFIALIDCTGHGISGALLSMLSYFLLQKVIKTDGASQVGTILDNLHLGFINALRQKEIEASSKDGIDITLCRINLKEKELQFAGAHLPLFHVHNGNLTTYAGNKFPVGGTQYIRNGRELKFMDHKIKIEKGDIIYFFSDGFPDQIGGPKNQRFTTPRIAEMIIKNHMLLMEEQSSIYAKQFDLWKGNNQQLDDVLMVGIRM